MGNPVTGRYRPTAAELDNARQALAERVNGRHNAQLVAYALAVGAVRGLLDHASVADTAASAGTSIRRARAELAALDEWEDAWLAEQAARTGSGE